MDPDLQDAAEQALALMRAQGFEQAQVSAGRVRQEELNINHDEPSLLRSTEQRKLSLLGILDGRMASTELAELAGEAVRERVASLFADAGAAPQDEANAVSASQRLRLVQGPQEADIEPLADTVKDLLAFRRAETPRALIDEGNVLHTLQRWHTLTSGGSELAGSLGCYGMNVLVTAREGTKASSFNYTGGTVNDLRSAPAAEHFGIGELLRDAEQQIETRPLPGKFVGDVVLTPNAVAALLAWLQGQLGDTQLIAGSSLYRDRVGQQIASPLLSLRSRFDAPGVAALSADAFATPPVELLRGGTLTALTPSLYGSRKTGLPHVPVAAGGWEIDAGATPRAQLVAGMARGAVVGRLSMGMPAANGDFSGVIKNSFLVTDGVVGPALSEAMVAGNMAQMLRDVVGVSRERIDTGSLRLPWLRITGLHFS